MLALGDVKKLWVVGSGACHQLNKDRVRSIALAQRVFPQGKG
jgi:hypothetical protein